MCCYFPNVFYILFLVISCWLNSNSFLLVSEQFVWHSHFDLNPEPLKFFVYLFRNQGGSRNWFEDRLGDRNSPEIYFPPSVNPTCNHEALCDLQTLQGWRGILHVLNLLCVTHLSFVFSSLFCFKCWSFFINILKTSLSAYHTCVNFPFLSWLWWHLLCPELS